MPSRRGPGLLLVLAGLWVFMLPLPAQQEEEAQAKPRIVETLVVNVKPGMDPQYEAYVKKAIAAYKETGSPQRWTAYRRYAGGDAYDYVFVWVHSKWAELDELLGGGSALVEVYGKEEAAKIVKSGRDAIRRVTRFIDLERPDMSLR